MNKKKINTVVQKHSSKLFIFGMIGIGAADILFNSLWGKGVSPLLTFIISFSLAIHAFQKILTELLAVEDSAESLEQNS